ncbi:hypothetical protein NNO04_22705, partial [Citrobacter sp. Awk 4]|uniref:hypothetical protein n=1 Tax=Citrobacter sp. Awk 4 TaxID=2963955 RepID=UPI00230375AA
ENVGDSSIFLNDGYLQATTYRIVLPEGMESFIDKDTSISNERIWMVSCDHYCHHRLFMDTWCRVL